ncbi:MAG: hypothetical protein H7320_13130 [Ferruginibacter sp.]|nr:hypothetical protein [Ferruginibacter sp.]
MTTHSREVLFELIDKSRQWSAKGCHSWSLSNVGNVNVTINKVLILEPGEDWEGPHENVTVIDMTDLDIEFDAKNDPEGYAPVGGSAPPANTLLPGDPPPKRDARLLISKSFLREI